MASAREGQGGMSTFKVGDLVDSPRFDRAGGTVVEIRDVYVKVEWPGMTLHYEYHRDELRLIAAVTPVAVAATLETATDCGIKVGARVRNVFDLIGTVAESDGRRFAVKWDDRDGVRRGFGASELWRVVPGPDGKYATPGVTQAEWSEAINAQHKALDTVRRFLGSHSFASCSLACNRELREVMAVVLKALEPERAGK